MSRTITVLVLELTFLPVEAFISRLDRLPRQTLRLCPSQMLQAVLSR